VQNDWCVFIEKVWSLPQRTAQMLLEEIGVVLACDCRMLGHSMYEDDAGTVVGEKTITLALLGFCRTLVFAG